MKRINFSITLICLLLVSLAAIPLVSLAAAESVSLDYTYEIINSSPPLGSLTVFNNHDFSVSDVTVDYFYLWSSHNQSGSVNLGTLASGQKATHSWSLYYMHTDITIQIVNVSATISPTPSPTPTTDPTSVPTTTPTPTPTSTTNPQTTPTPTATITPDPTESFYSNQDTTPKNPETPSPELIYSIAAIAITLIICATIITLKIIKLKHKTQPN